MNDPERSYGVVSQGPSPIPTRLLRFLYVARHGQVASNQEEEAITYALRELGHSVEHLSEVVSTSKVVSRSRGCDVLLFHKWCNLEALQLASSLKVFWYFDLVDCDDPTLRRRSDARIGWMKQVVPLVDMGFCTDGDWVRRWNLKSGTEELVWLPQGFDSRSVEGRGGRLLVPSRDPRTVPYPDQEIDILFTGTANGGSRRASFVDELAQRYGSRFLHVTKGLHGPELGALIQRAKIVVSPDYPVTDHYWSNRVYLTLGYGGFLLHPWSTRLACQYLDGRDLLYYANREDLHQQINRYLSLPEDRLGIAARGQSCTISEHSYLVRVGSMVDVIRQRLGEGG